MKQTVSEEGNTLFVSVPDLTEDRPTTLLADPADRSFFEAHRCRVIKGTPVTTAFNPATGLESPTPVVHRLLGLSPDIRIIHADSDPLNLKRANLKTRLNTAVNEFASDNTVSYLKLNNAQVVYIDAEDVERVAQYQWGTLHSHGRYVVACTYYQRDKKKTLLLNRFLLNMEQLDRRQVFHLNGDLLDHRKANLAVKPAGTPTEDDVCK